MPEKIFFKNIKSYRLTFDMKKCFVLLKEKETSYSFAIFLNPNLDPVILINILRSTEIHIGHLGNEWDYVKQKLSGISKHSMYVPPLPESLSWQLSFPSPPPIHMRITHRQVRQPFDILTKHPECCIIVIYLHVSVACFWVMNASRYLLF